MEYTKVVLFTCQYFPQYTDCHFRISESKIEFILLWCKVDVK